MFEQASLGELIAGIVYLTVGFRLLRLSGRTGELPERLLGATFLWMGISAILYVLPTWPIFESLWTTLSYAGRLTYIPASVMLAVFTRRVFRPNERWGNWLVWVSVILVVSGVGGSTLAGDLEGFSIRSGWFWLEWTGYTVPFAWACAEAFAQYQHAQRRVKLELCEPLICNRYLLWSLFGALQTFSSLTIIPQYYVYETTNQFTPIYDFVYGGFVIASLVMIAFVFFPPVFYRRWFESVDPAAAATNSDTHGEDARREIPV
jgi:hypothetical protein